MRYNPAVVAEGFATLSHLYPGRVFLGVGSGEALNEQVAKTTALGGTTVSVYDAKGNRLSTLTPQPDAFSSTTLSER